MSAENYLLSIYRLDEQDTRVTLTVLSEHLKTLPVDEGMGTSLPSVGGMIRRMVREGLLENTPQKDVVLTNSGRKSAESIVRRHRLAERLVVDLLGLDLHLAHIEAHRLEHAISPILEEKIVAALNNPRTCPVGHPIPGSGYKGDSRARALDQASAGDRLIIDSIPEDDQALLEYLVGNKLVPGQLVTVKETAVTRGVVTLDCEGGEVVFSYDVAAKIWICPAE
jgi:DtxR family Mn-dependent transcriptional regulator